MFQAVGHTFGALRASMRRGSPPATAVRLNSTPAPSWAVPIAAARQCPCASNALSSLRQQIALLRTSLGRHRWDRQSIRADRRWLLPNQSRLPGCDQLERCDHLPAMARSSTSSCSATPLRQRRQVSRRPQSFLAKGLLAANIAELMATYPESARRASRAGGGRCAISAARFRV